MHKYRAAARYAAWYDDENDDFPNYNPFQKVRTRMRTPEDEEFGTRVPTNQSESCAIPTIEENRRSLRIDPPQHASTMPSASQSPSLSSPIIRDMITEHKPTEKSEDSVAGTSETLVDKSIPETPQEGQPRRRRPDFAKLNLFKKDGEGKPTKPHSSSSLFAKDKHKFTAASQLRATILNSWINILLIFVPIGIAVNFVPTVPKVGVFVINFIAIIPLAAMLSYATEEIALRTGETIGGLLNATFGNAVELIVSIIALIGGQVDIVQQSLVGSMLSNLLLVMGMCFFFGGISRERQYFNITVAQTASSLLALAVSSLIVPSAFQVWADGTQPVKTTRITEISRGTAILLLLVYGCYLFFQLKTHASMYNAPSKKVEKRKNKPREGDATKGFANMGAGMAASMGGDASQETPVRKPEEDREQPQLSKWVALATLAISTALVALCAEYMVASIDAITQSGSVSRTFVGLILLPIVGNAAEHATAVTVACKDKMDLAIGVAIGSSMQIALLVIPFTVVLGWILNNELMNLAFNGFQVTVLFVTVLLVNYLIQDGESHWLEGILLQTLYLIIALAAWFYPPDDPRTNNTR